MIIPNTQIIYPCPSSYIDHFIVHGRRYYKTASRCLISDYGRYGMLPSEGMGFYLKISAKEFNLAKKQYEIARQKYNDSLKGNLNKGVQNSLF